MHFFWVSIIACFFLAAWTLAHSIRNLVPAPPLDDQTNFWAAPSARTMWKSKYMVMSPLVSPCGPLSLKPSLVLGQPWWSRRWIGAHGPSFEPLHHLVWKQKCTFPHWWWTMHLLGQGGLGIELWCNRCTRPCAQSFPRHFLGPPHHHRWWCPMVSPWNLGLTGVAAESTGTWTHHGGILLQGIPRNWHKTWWCCCHLP